MSSNQAASAAGGLKKQGSMNSSNSNRQSQVIRVFEELRQSISNINQIQDQRKSLNLHHDQIGVTTQNDEPGNHIRHQFPDLETDNLHTQMPIVNGQSNQKVGGPMDEKERRQMEIMKRDEHKVDLNVLASRLKSDLKNGLTQTAADQFNLEQGDNKLTEKKKDPLWKIYLREISNPFAIMLWVASIFCFFTYYMQPQDPSNLYLGFVLIIVILVTAQITFQQNKKSEALMDSFKSFLPQKCIVIRDGGQEKSINALKLVVGDIVKVKAGEKIPADLRMIQVNEMKVDNSPLTGESEPQIRTTICTHPDSLLETKNISFFGTLCKEGQGVGIVIKIGDTTTLGEIADMASTEKTIKTPLRIEMDRLIIVMVAIALSLGVLFFLLSYLLIGYDALTCVIFGIGILVANVPEGLLGCITVSLAITAQALHKKNVLVKNLEAVETLGSTSCICSDKTGTLTQNVMTVEHLWMNDRIIKAKNRKLVKNESELEYEIASNAFKQLHLSAVISSEAKFDFGDQKDKDTVDYLKCPVNGDATETGLIRFFQSVEDIEVTRQKYQIPLNNEKVTSRMPFNSTEKFALTIVELRTDNSDYCVYIKGAPEKIWKISSMIQNGDSIEKKNANWEKSFSAANKLFGKNGERVLGFAKLHLPRVDYPLNRYSFIVSNPKNFNFPIENCTFTGLVSLIDPPKTRVPKAILECRSAGIKVIMVTGDQPPTAASIARQVNIIPRNVKTIDEIMEEKNITWEEAVDECEAIVVHGDKIVQSLEREELEGIEKFTNLRKWVKKRFCVFARTTPAQKLQIVQACQKEGFICAVTGDGVNDSPAIKQGDIGISMNLTGSDVTKDAADMILLDDDFASIVSGVEEGRKIFDNLKKTFVYLLCSNVPEILPFLAFIAFAIPLPLTNIYMLTICVGTDIYPAISLAFEEAEIDIMTRKPRDKNDHMVSLRLMMHSYGLMGILSMSCGFLAYFTSLNFYGFPIKELFGMALYDAYKPPLRDFSTSNPMYGEMYNANIMVTGDCVKDLALMQQTGATDYSWTVDWFIPEEGQYDLRKSFVECNIDTKMWQSKVGSWGYCDIFSDHNYSKFVENTACYTTDALKYAQSAFFMSIVIFQWSNIFACKSRKSSFATSAVNHTMLHGIIFETALALILILVPGVDSVFGGRPLDFWQIGFPGVPFSILILAWEESRKYLIRTRNWFLKYSYW